LVKDNKKKTKKEIDVSKFTTSELLDLHDFVCKDFNTTFGDNADGKALVKRIYYKILNELRLRIYGCDPESLGNKSNVINGKLVSRG